MSWVGDLVKLWLPDVGVLRLGVCCECESDSAPIPDSGRGDFDLERDRDFTTLSLDSADEVPEAPVTVIVTGLSSTEADSFFDFFLDEDSFFDFFFSFLPLEPDSFLDLDSFSFFDLEDLAAGGDSELGPVVTELPEGGVALALALALESSLRPPRGDGSGEGEMVASSRRSDSPDSPEVGQSPSMS